MNEKQECVDEDECETGTHTCHRGRCVNTDPGFYCICEPGFIPTQDRKACLDGRQGNCFTTFSRSGQCLNKMPFKLSRIDCCCSQSMGKGWTFKESDLCSPCPSPNTNEYRLLCEVAGIPTQITRDIDECSLQSDLCPNGVCIDTVEGYRCQCQPGYEETADGGCRDKNECLQGVCQGGRCRNTVGDFECNCPPGFHTSADRTKCIDHNECGQTGMCSNGKCTNMDGTFRCECLPGFTLSPSGLSCIDVDECLENPRICLKGQCQNTPGSYICVCEDGFVHSADGGFCRDLNECSQTGMCDNGHCVNMEGGFKCICDPGYELSPNGKTCQDINECASNPCLGGTCTNTEGGVQCQCPPGFSLGSDGRTCTDNVQGLCYAMFANGQCINPSTKMVSKSTCCCCSVAFSQVLGWGSPCSACPAPGSPEFTQLCPHGSGFTHGGDDINECAQSGDICKNGACENLAGSYRCLSNPGYEVDATGKKCIDIDECAIDALLCNGGQCRNTPGSFQCICPTGTRLNAETNYCEDEDECKTLGSDACSGGTCVNTVGSYECRCSPGSVLDSTGRFCIDSQRGTCWTAVTNGQCENNLPSLTLKSECCCSVGVAWGSPCELCNPSDCSCPPGMAKTDGKTCQDINECLIDSGICKGGTCVNTEGSFTCNCPEGLSLDPSGTSCIDLREEPCFLDYRMGICSREVGGLFKRKTCCCTLGDGWGNKCSKCPRPGTQDFNQLCGKGFGFLDLVDVNECVLFSDICSNGRCKNSIGSYSCRCNQGFALDEDGFKCIDIDECEILHGVCGNGTCVNTEGSFTCDCHAGFEVTPMMQVCMDINECERDPTLCRGGYCINTPGSFQCQCPLGHELTEDGTECKDIDECGFTSGVCSNGVCENMMGTYQCICDEGYRQVDSGSSCEDVDECGVNNGGCDDLCINSPGSYSCSCSTGYMLLYDGQSCIDIDECVGLDNVCNGGECRNTPGGYSCVCSGGLMMGPDATSCLDLDECIIDPEVTHHECIKYLPSQ